MQQFLLIIQVNLLGSVGSVETRCEETTVFSNVDGVCENISCGDFGVTDVFDSWRNSVFMFTNARKQLTRDVVPALNRNFPVLFCVPTYISSHNADKLVFLFMPVFGDSRVIRLFFSDGS